MRRIELGDVARDKITGLTGVVVGDTKWLHGCRRLTIQPKELKDGEPVKMSSFDEPQMELIEEKVAETTGRTGGPAPEPTQRPTPSR